VRALNPERRTSSVIPFLLHMFDQPLRCEGYP
jgi:hypothetical protein